MTELFCVCVCVCVSRLIKAAVHSVCYQKAFSRYYRLSWLKQTE